MIRSARMQTKFEQSVIDEICQKIPRLDPAKTECISGYRGIVNIYILERFNFFTWLVLKYQLKQVLNNLSTKDTVLFNIFKLSHFMLIRSHKYKEIINVNTKTK